MPKKRKTDLKSKGITWSKALYSDIFSSCNIKSTKPRLAVLEVFSEAGQPLSAEDVFKIIKKKTGKNPDIVTIYRAIEIFEKGGFLLKVAYKDKVNRYEFTADPEHHHCHHAICEGCGVTEHIEDEEIEKALEVLAKKFKKVKFVKEHNLEFFGKCTSCKNS